MSGYQIVQQHDDFLLLYKHPGVSVHRDESEHGLLDSLREQYGSGLHLVHRLDKATSGLLLIARHPAAAQAFGELWRQRRVDKRYLAIAPGQPRKKQGWVVGDMAKGRAGGWKLLHSQQQPAVTYFHSYGLGNGLRLYLLRPYTGRTHQLRVALKSVGAAILGDGLYGGAAGDRVYLHAWALRFPWRGQALAFVCPPLHGDAFFDAASQEVIATLAAGWPDGQEADWPAPKPGWLSRSAVDDE